MADKQLYYRLKVAGIERDLPLKIERERPGKRGKAAVAERIVIDRDVG